jgi:hypothetical protein
MIGYLIFLTFYIIISDIKLAVRVSRLEQELDDIDTTSK